MSMTKEEAIERFEKQLTAAQAVLDSGFGTNLGESDLLYRRRKEMAEIALSALRPVSREQVEKVWRGEWMFPIFADQKDANDLRCQCSECGSIETPLARHRFCPSCGAPMTDEAVDMVMERWEALKDGSCD